MTKALKGSQFQFEEISKCVSKEEEIKAGETFAMYADRVIKNYERMLAGPKHTDNADTLKVAMLRFCAGLRNTELSTEIKRMIKTAKSMTELVEACEEIQATKNTLLRRNGQAQTQSYEESVEQLQNPEIKCFFCKKKGHVKKECFKFKKWLKNKQEEEAGQTGMSKAKNSQKQGGQGRQQGKTGRKSYGNSNSQKGRKTNNRRVQELDEDQSEVEGQLESSDEDDSDDIENDQDFQ